MFVEQHRDENDGYGADVSSVSEESSDVNSVSSLSSSDDKGISSSDSSSSLINNGHHDAHHRHSCRRRRHSQRGNAAVLHISKRMKSRRDNREHHKMRRTTPTTLSPIHPDIDASMTSLVSSTKFLDQQRRQSLKQPPQLSRAVRQAQVDVLSQLLMDYFATPRSISLPSQSSEDEIDSRQLGDGLIIDLPTIEPGTNAMLSSQHVFLEDALSLSSSPRLVIEAKKPHRVTYANAAFSHGMLGSKMNMHRWVEQQNSPESQHQHRTLDSVIQEVFATAPVVVYPVLGSGKVSHYLVEAVPNTAVQESSSPRTTASCIKKMPTPQQSEREGLSQTVG